MTYDVNLFSDLPFFEFIYFTNGKQKNIFLIQVIRFFQELRTETTSLDKKI